MSKKVEKQQKEAVIWKQRWEKSHSTLLKMIAEKQQLDSTYTLQAKQLAQLQKLCRTMQVRIIYISGDRYCFPPFFDVEVSKFIRDQSKSIVRFMCNYLKYFTRALLF